MRWWVLLAILILSAALAWAFVVLSTPRHVS